MSVSFYAEIVEGLSVPSVLECGCESWRSPVFASATDAAIARLDGKFTLGCADDLCHKYGVFIVPALAEPEVNLSNGNASEMLDNLGIQVGEDFAERCIGSMPAEDFKGRVLMALALCPADEGMPAYKLGSEEAPAHFGFIADALEGKAQAEAEGREGVTVWQCARREGYTQEMLGYLLEVAEYAQAQGREVVWG